MTLILLIDHYDSFTYNIKQLINEIGHKIVVYRPNQISVKEIKQLNPSAIILSSGPKNLIHNKLSHELIEEYKSSIPILGIGLGHLMIAEHFGAKIIPVQEIKHGKSALIKHSGTGAFSYLEQPLEVMRYHSFVIDGNSLPYTLNVTATALDNDEIMAIKHDDYSIYGFQFHPDSLGTLKGQKLIENFLTEI